MPGRVYFSVKITQFSANVLSFLVRNVFLAHLAFERVLPINERIEAFPGGMNSVCDAIQFCKLVMRGKRANPVVPPPGQSFINGVCWLAIKRQSAISPGFVLNLIGSDAEFSAGFPVFVEPA